MKQITLVILEAVLLIVLAVFLIGFFLPVKHTATVTGSELNLLEIGGSTSHSDSVSKEQIEPRVVRINAFKRFYRGCPIQNEK